MARYNTEIGGYVSSNSHFQQYGDGKSDYEKSIAIFKFQPKESKVEEERLAKNADSGRTSENINETILTRNTTVTTKNVTRLTSKRDESKVTQNRSRRELLRTEIRDEGIQERHSRTSAFNSYSHDRGVNVSKREEGKGDERFHRSYTNSYGDDFRESLWKGGGQTHEEDSSGSDASIRYDRQFDLTDSLARDSRSSDPEKSSSTSSRYGNDKHRGEISREVSDKKDTEYGRGLTSSQDRRPYTDANVTSFGNNGDAGSLDKISPKEEAKAATTTYSETYSYTSSTGISREPYKTSTTESRYSRSRSEDCGRPRLRNEDRSRSMNALDCEVTRHDISSLGKVVDDLKAQSSSLEQTIGDLKKKGSKSLEGIAGLEKSRKGRKSTSDVVSPYISEMTALKRESASYGHREDPSEKMYREIPARAEYISITHESLLKKFDDDRKERDVPLKDSASSFSSSDFPISGIDSQVQRTRDTNVEEKKDVHRSESVSATTYKYVFSRDGKVRRGETKTEEGILENGGVLEKEAPSKKGSDDFLESKANESLGQKKIHPTTADITKERIYRDNKRSEREASVKKHFVDSIRIDTRDPRGQMTISLLPSEKTNGKKVGKSWRSEKEAAMTDPAAFRVGSRNSQSHITTTLLSSETSKETYSRDSSRLEKEATAKRDSTDSLAARDTYYLLSHNTFTLPSSEKTEQNVVTENWKPNETTARKDTADYLSGRDAHNHNAISQASREHKESTTVMEEVKEVKPSRMSALRQKIEELKITVDSLNGLRSKKELEEYVKQHPAKKVDIEQEERERIQKYVRSETRVEVKNLGTVSMPENFGAMTLEEVEIWQREIEITREKERKERLQALERKRQEARLERERQEKVMIQEREKEEKERRERLFSLERKMEAAKREREELRNKREAEQLERERQERQEDDARLKREREIQRRESIRLETEREALVIQLNRLKRDKEERAREEARLERERQDKLKVIEREKEAAKLEREKLDKERQQREWEVARVEREQEEKLIILRREKETARLDREQLARETDRLERERRDKLVLLEREKEAARLEREKLENERQEREEEVAGIGRELQQKLLILQEEKDAARLEREELERQAARLEIERQVKLTTLEEENKAARLERERLENERRERKKEAARLEKEQQEKLVILQREIEAARLERETFEEERQEREKEAANLERRNREKFLVLEREKEIVKLEREKLEEERQEREREAVQQEKGQQVKLMILEKEKEAARLEREELIKAKEATRHERDRLERQREASIQEEERRGKMMRLEIQRKAAEMEREQHEKMLSLEKENEATRREKERLEQEKEAARRQLREVEEQKESAKLERQKEALERQKEALERQKEADRLKREQEELSSMERLKEVAKLKEEESRKLQIIQEQRETERLEREQHQHAEIQQRDFTDAGAFTKKNVKVKSKTADAGITYVEIDHLQIPRANNKEGERWWSASTAEDVDRILELGNSEWWNASTAEGVDQILGNEPQRRPRRMNIIRRRSVRRRNGRPRALDEDDKVEVRVRVRRKEKAPNLSRYTVTSQAPVEKAIILRQTRSSPESSSPYIRNIRVDDGCGGDAVSLDNGVVKIKAREGWRRRAVVSKALKRGEKLSESSADSSEASWSDNDDHDQRHKPSSDEDSSLDFEDDYHSGSRNSDGSIIVPMEGNYTESKSHGRDNQTESAHHANSTVPIKISVDTTDKTRTRRLRLVRELKRNASFGKARRTSTKKLSGTKGKYKNGNMVVSAVTGGAITVRDGNKAYCTPVQVVERMRRLYRTTNRASGWTYNGGRLEVTVQAIPPSPATVDLQQLGDRMFSATIAGSDALRHSQTSHDDRFKLRHTGNLSENRMWNVHDGSVPHVSRTISGGGTATTFDEKHETTSDKGYNTMSDGEVGKSTYRRVGELSGRGYSPTGGFKTWTTTGSQQEKLQSGGKLESRKMSWVVGDVSSELLV